jgi:DNA-binding PadR family transcriptional regulator
MKRKESAKRQGPRRRRRVSKLSLRTARPAAGKKLNLTTPDLVLLSLLAERPMHGYQANLELERRDVRDWAGISRPQVYYSLEKLSRRDLIWASESAEPVAGPERAAFSTTAKGREALADALECERWARQRDRPPFLTWLALCSRARAGAVRQQVERRAKYLKGQLAREKATLRAVLAQGGRARQEALWMITLVIEQFETELRWLKDLRRALPLRSSPPD